jgi:hypothetical protein
MLLINRRAAGSELRTNSRALVSEKSTDTVPVMVGAIVANLMSEITNG